MVDSGSQIRIYEFRDENNSEKAADIADDRKDDGKAEDHDFLPKMILRDVNVNRRKHRHRGQRANAAATFSDHKIETMVARGKRCPDRIDVQTDQLAQETDRGGNYELKPKRCLFNRTKRNEKDQECAREQNDARRLFTP
jgi:hypothetical protein